MATAFLLGYHGNCEGLCKPPLAEPRPAAARSVCRGRAASARAFGHRFYPGVAEQVCSAPASTATNTRYHWNRSDALNISHEGVFKIQPQADMTMFHKVLRD